jgi:hypothetical protein
VSRSGPTYIHVPYPVSDEFISPLILLADLVSLLVPGDVKWLWLSV